MAERVEKSEVQNNQSAYQQQYQPLKEAVLVGSETILRAPKLVGVPTGVEGLDGLFYTTEMTQEGPRKVSLGGIPKYGIFNLTGVSDTGKSLIAEQFAVKQASRGESVIFVTVESPAEFVVMGIKQRAQAMGIDFEEIKDKIIFIDVASYSSLRDNLAEFFATLAYAIKTYKAEYTVVDSITGLFEEREVAARIVVRKVFSFLKKWKQTALLISQKRSGHEELTAEAAGGYAVGHIVDGTFVVAKELVDTPYKAKMYKVEVGDVVRFFRIDGCRLTGHDTKLHRMEITETGLVRIL
ncbi:KaiC domain-containing protein [Fervidobacterium thailandense]|uniref:Circadian clock protein KaiC n=1 Tax=Fervidobacterium thailandense TaxID=1008305 RepID=A0A1E3G0U5_9BACT|nr:KaiC domain-containing protein [Fervidobacterium thailandense]ODN29871.1 circadian clock protein KaiC [Fervidobacterium thailandense]